MASRMGIISVAYIQQALATLLNSINNGQGNMDSFTQSIRDSFSMSTKSLDQLGRTGAFLYWIRRKAAKQDSVLNTLKDNQIKIVCLHVLLTTDEVFGKKLEEKLKERKEQKDSLKDFIPEWNDRVY